MDNARYIPPRRWRDRTPRRWRDSFAIPRFALVAIVIVVALIACSDLSARVTNNATTAAWGTGIAPWFVFSL
jgi:hypothetical protein